MLGDYRSIADFNPLAHLLDLVRRPAMGEWPSLTSFIVAGVGAVLGWVLAGSVFVAVRTRLPLWI
jgi:lipopolysaccharide transport system permease protein